MTRRVSSRDLHVEDTWYPAPNYRAIVFRLDQNHDHGLNLDSSGPLCSAQLVVFGVEATSGDRPSRWNGPVARSNLAALSSVWLVVFGVEATSSNRLSCWDGPVALTKKTS